MADPRGPEMRLSVGPEVCLWSRQNNGTSNRGLLRKQVYYDPVFPHMRNRGTEPEVIQRFLNELAQALGLPSGSAIPGVVMSDAISPYATHAFQVGTVLHTNPGRYQVAMVYAFNPETDATAMLVAIGGSGFLSDDPAYAEAVAAMGSGYSLVSGGTPYADMNALNAMAAQGLEPIAIGTSTSLNIPTAATILSTGGFINSPFSALWSGQ
jgi:hypothetical protein